MVQPAHPQTALSLCQALHKSSSLSTYGRIQTTVGALMGGLFGLAVSLHQGGGGGSCLGGFTPFEIIQRQA